MILLGVVVVGFIVVLFISQLNSRLINLKIQMLQANQKLQQKIESLERRVYGTESLEQHVEPVTPEPVIAEAIVLEPAAPIEYTPIDYSTSDSIPLGMREDEPRASTTATSDFFGQIKNYFMTGNTLVKVGVVLIIFGFSFLLKYAIENDMLPIEVRLLGSALFGIGLLALGWRLKDKSRDYALVLQGGGIGVLMLTVFASLKLYGLVSPVLAFALLVFLTVATCALALRQDSLNLAAFGLLGGFLAPILVSTGQGQHVVLFSYYTVLNLGVVFIAWQKSWRELNVLGFVFTFVIATIWGVLKYNPALYWSTQPFLILFFLIYLTIAVVFAGKKEPELRGHIDGTIVFGNSLFTLALQLQLVKGIEYAGALSALLLAGLYLFLGRYLIKHRNSNYHPLAEAFISIAVVFATLAIPLAFDGVYTSAIWALEAAGIYWFATRQNRPMARYFSTFLIFAASFAFFTGSGGASKLLFLNAFFISCMLMAVSTYAFSYFSEKYSANNKDTDSTLTVITFVMATLWWVLGGIHEIDKSSYGEWGFFIGKSTIGTLPAAFIFNIKLMYMTVGAAVVLFVGKKIEWDKFRYLAHGFVFILMLAFLHSFRTSHPFGNFGYVSWSFAFLVYYGILFFNDKKFALQNSKYLQLGHAGALWVLVGVLAMEMSWVAINYLGTSSAWAYAAQALAPILVFWLITLRKELLPWPIQRHHSIYMNFALAPMAAVLWFWLMLTNWSSSGSIDPLPYMPLLNPLELSHICLLLVGSVWALRWRQGGGLGGSIPQKDMAMVLGGTYFIWLNGVLSRAVHHYFGVPYNFQSLFASVELQVAFSLFWTLLGISIMIYASKKQHRWLWVTGASLLAVVVCKMILVDLSKTETMARIISFIGVGILFLVVGYFSPIPPKQDASVRGE